MIALWDFIQKMQEVFEINMSSQWVKSNPGDMEDDIKNKFKSLKEMRCDKKCNTYLGIQDEIKKWLVFLPLITDLRDPAMRPRHWDSLKKKVQKDFTVDEKLLLRDVFNLNLTKYVEDVEEITDQARQEAKMEKTLEKLEVTWKDVTFEFTQHKNTDLKLIRLSEENFEMLEENQVAVTSMFSSRYLSTFEERCVYWQKSLAGIAEVIAVIAEVQRLWSFLENLFIGSEEVKKELPKESEKFVGIDKEVKVILKNGEQMKIAIEFCNQKDILKRLEDVQTQLTLCEKALNDFMDGKRRAFPRFYFVATADLLDILSNGNAPNKIMCHMPKIFQAIETLYLKEDGDRPTATGMETCVGKEVVQFPNPLKLVGKVENYLMDVIDCMKSSLNIIASKSVVNQHTMKKNDWLKQDPAQITLLVNMTNWSRNVEAAFASLKTNPKAMQGAFDDQVNGLSELIKLVQGDLEKPMR
jgi:dynein heavy chain, axonemal